MKTKKGWSIGIDEAGRGPWAGPVYVCACAVPTNQCKSLQKNLGLKDSKKLSEKQRNKIHTLLEEKNLKKEIFSVVVSVSPSDIDALNIKQATKKGMEIALTKLWSILKEKKYLIDSIRIDGNDKFIFSQIQEEITYCIRGDDRYPEIQAAALQAKVWRDLYMTETVHKLYPQYAFDAHKWYGTKRHQEALLSCGPCPEHRFSFRPVKNAWKPTENT